MKGYSSTESHYLNTFGKTLNELQADISKYSKQGILPDLMRIYLQKASDASHAGNHKVARPEHRMREIYLPSDMSAVQLVPNAQSFPR